MKTCPECDTPTTADAATCVVCGARLDQAAREPDDAVRLDDDVPADDGIPSEDPVRGDDGIRADDGPAGPPADIPPAVASDTPTQEADVPTETTTQTDPTAAPPVDEPAVGDPAAPPTDDASIPPPSPDQVTWPAAVPSAGGQAPPLPPSAPPAPGAIALDESVRNWGLLAHVSGLVSSAMVGMGFVGPLIVWVLKRDDHPFVAQNAAEALNFQLSMMLYGILLVVASLPVITLLLTLPLALVGFLLWLVLPIVAAVKASKGESWTYPITIGFVRP